MARQACPACGGSGGGPAGPGQPDGPTCRACGGTGRQGPAKGPHLPPPAFGDLGVRVRDPSPGAAHLTPGAASPAALARSPNQADTLEDLSPTEACRSLKMALRAGLVADPAGQAFTAAAKATAKRAEADAMAYLARCADRANLGLKDLAGTYREAARESAQEARQAADRAAGALGAAEALRAAYRAATGGDL